MFLCFKNGFGHREHFLHSRGDITLHFVSVACWGGEGEWKNKGESEREKGELTTPIEGRVGEPFSCYCFVTYEWRLEVFGVTRNLIERNASLRKYPYT
jgi:hypothetical protein